MKISDYYINIHTKQSDEQDTISNPLPIESIQLVERMQVMAGNDYGTIPCELFS